MPIVSELSLLVKRRRQEMGITQERLAELAGLSRATINQLETGKMANLSLLNAERLANFLGYGLGITGARKSKDAKGSALQTAAQTASVSYTHPLPPEVLRKSLETGTVPPKYIPQLRTLLDEAPVGVLSALAHELEAEGGASVRSSWQRMRALATAVGCTRAIWN
jgi:transcriptional regulator with XRE-family HTH domain